jgi:hypothetical protein
LVGIRPLIVLLRYAKYSYYYYFCLASILIQNALFPI